jgi:MFS family permease
LLTPQAYDEYVRKNATWNFVVNMLDLTFYSLATSFIFGATVLTLYTSYLTDSKTLIGLIPAVQAVGFYLPQLLLARRSQRWRRKKPGIQIISIFERLPYLLIGVTILAWPAAPKWVAYLFLALGMGLATMSGGLGAPAWKAMLAKVIPARRRGLMFGLAQALGGGLGIAGAFGSRWVLQNYAYPTSYAICFLLCFVFQVVSWICLTLNREPPQEPTGEELSSKAYFRQLPRVLRDNPNFTRYLLASVFIILGGMATSFYVVYSRETFAIDDAFAANLTMAALFAQTMSTPLLGWLGDHRGHKWLTEFAVLAGVAGVVLALVAPSRDWMIGVFMLVNLGTSGLMVANMTITMEFCCPEQMPTFTALGNTILSVPILLTPVIGGWLIDVSGYRVLFLVAMVLALVGWASMRWLVHEPRHARVEAIGEHG